MTSRPDASGPAQAGKARTSGGTSADDGTHRTGERSVTTTAPPPASALGTLSVPVAGRVAWRQPGPPQRRWMLAAVITLCLLALLLAKAEFNSPTSDAFFYVYGLAVTAMVLLQMTVAFFVYRDPYDACRQSSPGASATYLDDAARPGHPLVSCLVAVHNDEAIIEDCLRSLCEQRYARTEVIVINDASTDGTGEILDRLALTLPVRVIHLADNVGKKGALVRGTELAGGSILAFTDSDSLWHPEALERIVAVLEADDSVGAVSGHCRARNANTNLITKIQDTWYEGQFSVRKAFESVFGAVTCVSGPLAVFRREAIFNLMPAWERDHFLGDQFRFATDRTLTGYVLGAQSVTGKLLASTAPDSPFLRERYPARKWRVVYCKSALALTEVPDTLQKVLRQQVRWKKSFLRNIFLTGRFYWRRPLPPALVYYLHILFVLAGPLVAFRHLVYLPMHGNTATAVLYIFGIAVIGSAFGLAHKAEEPASTGWLYRPLMSLLSTLMLSWLIFYSLSTIKKMTWSRG
jgi:cellulose synthase/poly-beta-1,6-N-acetylglucosamine synthase-like glycosyltransferase